MRIVTFLIFLVLWLIHFLTMSGAAVASVLRLWEERDGWLARRLIILMGMPALLGLQAILLPLMMFPQGSVKFNLKFRIAAAATNLLIDICMTIFAVGILKARKK